MAPPTSARRRILSVAIASLGTACATAPRPVAPPAVTFETKMSWVLRLEDQRVLRDPVTQIVPPPTNTRGGAILPPAPLSPDLVRLLADQEARVRRRTALAVGRVGLAEGMPPLAKLLLSDPEAEVRQMAAFALGLIGDRAAIDPLQQALGDPSPLVAGRAAEALGIIGDPAPAVAIGEMVATQLRAGAVARVQPDELAYPLDPSVEAFRLGIYALARLKTYEPFAAAVLSADGQPLVHWWPVAFALQSFENPRGAAALSTLARSDSWYARAFAARGLGALKDRAATPVLLSLIDSASWTDSANSATGPVIEAIRALGRIGDPKAAAALLKVMAGSKSNPSVRAEAILAMGGTGIAGAEDLFLDLLSDPSPGVRAATLTTLAKVDPDTFMTVLSGLDLDPLWSTRAALASVLATLGAERALPRLFTMLSDSDLRVIPSVLDALTKLRAPDDVRLLLDRLKSDDMVVRKAAARNLGELKPEGGADALVAAYKFGDRDASYVARAAAVEALAGYGAAAATPTLRAALSDKDWAVRVRAAELLRPLDPGAETVSAIRPASITHPPIAYDAPSLVNPPVSPHVYVETQKGTFEIELAVLDAPLTCETFMTLARKGFFNGLSFHRVVPNFVVQAGDPRGDGEGGPGFTIRDEINQRPYLRGTVGMALDWHDTGGSQFFVTLAPQPQLDSRYTVFGQVVAGMDVVDRLSQWDLIKDVRVWDGTQVSAVENDRAVSASRRGN